MLTLKIFLNKINYHQDKLYLLLTFLSLILFCYLQKSVIINFFVILISSLLIYYSLMIQRLNKVNEQKLNKESLKGSPSQEMDRMINRFLDEKKRFAKIAFFENEQKHNYNFKEEEIIKTGKEEEFSSMVSENKKKIKKDNDVFSFKLRSCNFKDQSQSLIKKKVQSKKRGLKTSIFSLGPIFKSLEHKKEKILPKFEVKKDIFISPKKEKVLDLNINNLKTDKKEEIKIDLFNKPLLNLNLNRNDSKKTEKFKPKPILFNNKIDSKLEQIEEESVSAEDSNIDQIPINIDSGKKGDFSNLNQNPELKIEKEKAKEESIQEILSPEKINEIIDYKSVEEYEKVVTEILAKGNIKNGNFEEDKNKLMKFFSQICFEIDEHFMNRIQELVQLFNNNQDNEKIYLYLVRALILKIFSDLRERYNSSPITIVS